MQEISIDIDGCQAPSSDGAAAARHSAVNAGSAMLTAELMRLNKLVFAR